MKTAFGKLGEDIALKFLLKKGYHLLFRNWRYRHLEVDLIMQVKDCIVFIEVKTRSRPEDVRNLFSNTKQRNLVNAADAYFKQYEPLCTFQFDLITVLICPQQRASIVHIPEAFYPIC